MHKFKKYTCGLVVISGPFLLAPISSQAQKAVPATVYKTAQFMPDKLNEGPEISGSRFAKFIPQATAKKTRLDYQIWDEALRNVVLDLGPSLRKRARRPDPTVGSKFVHGHKSAYRLEGSRVTFSYVNDLYVEGLTAYRKDLEDIGTRLDITTFSRNEQLAYWFNLHNVAVIEQIALNYPIDRPANIKLSVSGSKASMDEARFITVKGEALSLKDIREKIVYANWTNPDVIYGFFRGNIGSPKLPRVAYTGSSIDYLLKENAVEFVNALRGFHEAWSNRNVSVVYEEAASIYFKNWEEDLTAHLLKHAERETVAEVNSGKPFKVDTYDKMIADLSGGRRLGSSGTPIRGRGNMSVETARLLSEVREKQRTLKAKGIIGNQNGYVIIEDIETNPDQPVE